MTVTSTTTVVSATGNGVTTVFPYAFLIPSGTQQVTLTTLSTGVEGAALVEGVDYSITGLGNPAGGNVTYPLSGSPLASTHKINIRRQMTVEQTLDLTTQSAYDPAVLEQTLDNIVMVLLNHKEQLSRTVYMGTGASLSAQDFLTQAQALVAAINGKQNLWIPADEMVTRITAGAARVTAELPVNKQVLSTLDFDDTTRENALIYVTLPKRWNASSLTAQFFWTTTAAVAGNVRWGIEGRSFSPNANLDQAYGTPQEVDGGVVDAVNELRRSAETANFSATGDDKEDMVILQVYRNPTHANDTMVGDAKLIGVRLTWTSDAANDA